MNQSKWRFVNESRPGEEIIVQDAASAETLKQLLGRMNDENWTLLESKPLSKSKEKEIVPPPLPAALKATLEPRNEERRKEVRHNIELRIILITGTSSFRTLSQNMSIGGLKLKKPVPTSFLQQKCIAYISHESLDENIEIVCEVISDPKDSHRIQFLSPENDQLKRLEAWIIEKNKSKAS